MGKDWLYWATRSTKRRGKPDKTSSSTSPTSGCMTAVFQLFDNFHHFHFAVPSSISDPLPEEPNALPKGVEAPRNSLESESPLMEVASSTVKQEHSLSLPVSIQIKTRAVDDVSSSECSSSSPGTRTPNLVARLMGLDLLPELSSPRPSASSNYSTTTTPKSSSHHCRSLPETPRISITRRSDADTNHHHHHRHSLQITNKDNIFTSEEFELSSYLNAKLARRRESRQELDDENKDSSLYAKQLVKQVKDNISSRRVGADITNTITTERKKDQRRDQHLVLLKSKKPALTRMGTGQDDDSSILSCSPRLRFLQEVKSKPPPSATKTPQSCLSPKMSQIAGLKEKEKEKENEESRGNKLLKKISSDQRYDFRQRKSAQTSDAIKNKQEEPFIRSSTTSKAKLSDKKCRKTPLSNNLVNINAPKFLSLKKDPSPSSSSSSSSSTTRSSQNQVPLESSRLYFPRSQSRSYTQTQTETQTLTAQYKCGEDNNSNGAIPFPTTAGEREGDDEIEGYISSILKHIGIDKNTPISITQWYSPSHPLHHPSILHFHHHTRTGTGSSSRLMFELTDELLVDILKPYMNLRPWVQSPMTSSSVPDQTMMCGWQLIEKVGRRMRSFPGADCRVLEDIDALIDSDLCRSTQLQREIAFEEEGEGIVTEIERDIVDTLVHETAMVMWHVRTRR